MKFGVYSPFSPEIIDLLKEVGANSIELACWPGSYTDADIMLTNKSRYEEVVSAITSKGIEISALGFYPNHLDPDLTKREASNKYLLKLIDLASKMDVKVVSTFAGRVPDKDIPDNIPIFKEVFTPIIRYAEDKGVKIAIENCPMMHGFPFRGINIAYTPKAWELMFDAIPSPNLGLEFDPSHLYWQQIDYIDAIYRFGDKIFHVHAKDTEILYDRLAEVGIYSTGWWRYRIPGWGEIDWLKVVSALMDVRYEGAIDIEHEDPVFSGAKAKEGMILGLRHLAQYII
ncbi:MAG: sugar phosphate isomerase/epimerase [bacterium]|nr:sugar phosphate isomerase/epimerase [bacterium]